MRLKEQRSARLAAIIQRNIAAQFQELFPGQFISVTGVEVTPDLHIATIWIAAIGDVNPSVVVEQVMEHRGQLRRGLGAGTDMRYVPRIEFRYDETGEQAASISRRLRS